MTCWRPSGESSTSGRCLWPHADFVWRPQPSGGNPALSGRLSSLNALLSPVLWVVGSRLRQTDL